MLLLGLWFPARQLHLPGILQDAVKPRRWLLRQASMRGLPVELLLREGNLRTVVPRCPDLFHLLLHRYERLALLRTLLGLDHLIYLVEVWVLLIASLPWLEHFILG